MNYLKLKPPINKERGDSSLGVKSIINLPDKGLIVKRNTSAYPEYKIFNVTNFQTNGGAAIHQLNFSAINWITPTDTKLHGIYLAGDKQTAAGVRTRCDMEIQITAITGVDNFLPQGTTLNTWTYQATNVLFRLSASESFIPLDKNEIILPKGVTVSLTVTSVGEFATGDGSAASLGISYIEIPN